MKRYALTLDLKNDPALIEQYLEYHKKIWPEITHSIKDAGIENMEIYRYGSRLFMTMVVQDDFSFEKKTAMDQNNLRVQEWEALMWNYQQPVEGAAPGEKWVLMEQIFELEKP
jgi:L-rhamnose mutarotase